MKICSKCGIEKDKTEFRRHTKRTNYVYPYCKVCHRAKMRAHYSENRPYYLAKADRVNKSNVQWFIEYKNSLKCELCSEDHPATLDFHHKNPKEKEHNIGSMRNWSKDALLKEIEKCLVLCANCHRKFHWNEKHQIN